MMRPLLLCLLLSSSTVVAFQLGGSRSTRLSTELLASTRRTFLSTAAASAATAASSCLIALPTIATAADAGGDDTSSLPDLLSLVKEARLQLNQVPSLIANEKWDSVRAVLTKPPLSDCWSKTTRSLLPKYAEAVGNADGDELAALEAKEELISHLRYLDMSAYNNNFNPIKSEGTNGATKALVQSYYEDPTNELKASIQAFDELIQLAGN